jgi:endonuclease I
LEAFFYFYPMKKTIFFALISIVVGACSSDSGSEGPKGDDGEDNTEVPVAVDDEFTVTEDQEAVLSGLIDNDDTANNARIGAMTTSTDEGGTLEDNRDGTYTYNPPQGFTGTDTFSYDLCDSDDNCDTATVTLIVEDEGSPVAENDEAYAVEGVSVQINGLTDNDDLTDDATIGSLDLSNTQGTVTLNNDGSITYEPADGFTGEDTFDYQICDDDAEASCSSATVTVTVLEAVAFNIPASYSDYYSNLAISTDQDLNFEVLRQLTVEKHTTILSYGERHEYLYDADEDLDNPDNVILMYTGESRYWEEYTSGNNPYSPQTFNTEHIFPQSLLDSDDAVTDLHHLRCADATVNGDRSNYPYADGSGEATVIGGNTWYPGDDWRGDVARMVLYLNVRYGETIASVGDLSLFLQWNIQDPVSDFEVQRNNVIAGAQGNRNPFIDNPYLVTLVYGGADAENTWE